MSSTAPADAELAPASTSIIDRMTFRGSWRDYQQRVLDEFDGLVSDLRIHIVAAPGSGKTILGIELLRRIGQPALILSPTLAIRNQWSNRLYPLFLDARPKPEDISFDLAEAAMVTSSTYQSLHSQWKNDRAGFDLLVQRLAQTKSCTIVLDECHHLRREWWNALDCLLELLPAAHVIALTATPPYDAPFAEWQRYDAACGPIDLEIGVPELVRNGDLCPHQDHVILSQPDDRTLAFLDERRGAIADLCAAVLGDREVLDHLQSHPWLTRPDDHVEAILEEPQVLSAILVHLAAAGRPLPPRPLALLGVSERDIPMVEPRWTRELLDALLHRHRATFAIGDMTITRYRRFLNEHGLIEGKRVCLSHSRSTFAMMAGSLAKLQSIVEIARAEAASLSNDLRLVVLTDHVRADELPRSFRGDYRPPKLGVVPIFDVLRRAAIPGARIAILSGSLVVVATSALPQLLEKCARRDIAPENISITPTPDAENYVSLQFDGAAASRKVELITSLLQSGDISLLVGTQSLLGEGWDAPSVNSLVLASNSAAFMLSNQMRGRAIRIDPREPAKVANIWHLATVDGGEGNAIADHFNWGSLNDDWAIRSDVELLQRRFRAFEAISNDGGNLIQSGLERLAVDFSIDVEHSNASTFALARDRRGTAEKWQLAIGDASDRAHVREIASATHAPRSIPWTDTIRWLMASTLSGGTLAAARAMAETGGAGIASIAMIGAGAFGIYAVPKTVKAGWLALRHRSLESSIAEVGTAVLAGLRAAGTLSPWEADTAIVRAKPALSGRLDIMVENLGRASERAVIEAIGEVIGPVRNPRYLLVRNSMFGAWGRKDFHAVPTAIGARKEYAETFHQAWKKNVGPSRLVFVRTPEGRLELLQARVRSFAARFQRRVDRLSAWR